MTRSDNISFWCELLWSKVKLHVHIKAYPKKKKKWEDICTSRTHLFISWICASGYYINDIHTHIFKIVRLYRLRAHQIMAGCCFYKDGMVCAGEIIYTLSGPAIMQSIVYAQIILPIQSRGNNLTLFLRSKLASTLTRENTTWTHKISLNLSFFRVLRGNPSMLLVHNWFVFIDIGVKHCRRVRLIITTTTYSQLMQGSHVKSQE